VLFLFRSFFFPIFPTFLFKTGPPFAPFAFFLFKKISAE